MGHLAGTEKPLSWGLWYPTHSATCAEWMGHLVADKCQALAVRRPIGDIHRTIASNQVDQRANLFIVCGKDAQGNVLVGGVRGHVWVVGDEDDRLAVRRRVGRPVL